MTTVPTFKVKADNARGYRVINQSDFDQDKDELFDDEEARSLLDPASRMEGKDKEMMEEYAARKRAEGNYGLSGGRIVDGSEGVRNPSGTFSEPTPTDIRYPDKLATEFENNKGAHVGRSAAGVRRELGMDDEPGGIKPSVREGVEENAVEAERSQRAARKAAAETMNVPLKEQAETGDDLSGKTTAELKEVAAEKGIDLGGATKKADIKAKVEEAGKSKA